MKNLFIVIFFVLSFIFSAEIFLRNPIDVFNPEVNYSINTNYSLQENNYEILSTMTYSVDSWRILLFISIAPKNGLFLSAFNSLKEDAKRKYGNNIGFINVVATQRNNLIFPIGLLWGSLYKEEVIVSADIIKFKN
tara:strand:- start:906 stop:1313 length:408 start_codon:yes stop_codon:yes gene_type:complete